MRASKELRLTYTEKAQQIVDRLTLEQKVWLMSGNIDFTKFSPEKNKKMVTETLIGRI